MGSFNSLLNNIKRVYLIHRAPTIIKICINFILNRIFWFTPRIKKKRAASRLRNIEFDQKWGLDTGGLFNPSKSEVIGSNWFYGQKYEGSNPSDLYPILDNMQIQYEKFTFIDMGSGKGRALLIASSFPFKKIIGVEYSELLCHIARKNILKYPDSEKSCKNIEVVHADVVNLQIPEDHLIIYLFNPFGSKIMKEVYNKVKKSYQSTSHRIIIIYNINEFNDIWRNSDFMEEYPISKRISIYDTHHSESLINF